MKEATIVKPREAAVPPSASDSAAVAVADVGVAVVRWLRMPLLLSRLYRR